MVGRKCENCGKIMGPSDESFSYYNYVVCRTCKGQLESLCQPLGANDGDSRAGDPNFEVRSENENIAEHCDAPVALGRAAADFPQQIGTEIPIAEISVEQDRPTEYIEPVPESPIAGETERETKFEASQFPNTSPASRKAGHNAGQPELSLPQAKHTNARIASRLLDSVGWMLLTVGWIILVVFCVILVGVLQLPWQRDPIIDSLLAHPDGQTIMRSIRVTVGFNFPSLLACLCGICVLVQKNPRGKALILASSMVFLFSTVYLFLPSSESVEATGGEPTSATVTRYELTTLLDPPDTECRLSRPASLLQLIGVTGNDVWLISCDWPLTVRANQ